MKPIAVILVGLVCLGAQRGVAADARTANAYTVALSKVVPPELPAKAAALVKNAQAGDRNVTTVDVVKAALQANPASACAVVHSISKAAPEVAPVAAGTAAELQPKQAAAIARAAASAAPSKAAKIVVAVCRAVPNCYAVVALAVCDAVPGSDRAVLAALSAAFPGLKAGIDKALANYSGGVPSAEVVLDQAVPVTVASLSGSTGARGPTVQGPYTPLNGTPDSVNSSDSVPVPSGGRTYDSP